MTETPLATPTSLVLSRLGDFFAHWMPWHRRLWNIGTYLALREVLEYADACLTGAVSSNEGLRFVVAATLREVRRDPGVAPLSSEIESCLEQLGVASASKVPVAARDELDHLARRVEVDYLDNWCTATNTPTVEFEAARATVARADARAKVSRPSNDGIHLVGWARIANDKREYSVRPTQQQIGWHHSSPVHSLGQNLLPLHTGTWRMLTTLWPSRSTLSHQTTRK